MRLCRDRQCHDSRACSCHLLLSIAFLPTRAESRAHCLWRSRARSLPTSKRLQGAWVPRTQAVRNDGKPSRGKSPSAALKQKPMSKSQRTTVVRPLPSYAGPSTFRCSVSEACLKRACGLPLRAHSFGADVPRARQSPHARALWQCAGACATAAYRRCSEGHDTECWQFRRARRGTHASFTPAVRRALGSGGLPF